MTAPRKDTFSPPLGTEVQASITGQRDVIGGIDVTGTGNIVLRIGRSSDAGDRFSSWSQTAHVVLTVDEANDLVNYIESVTHGYR